MLGFLCIANTVISSETISPHDIKVSIKVPDMGWRIQIDEIYRHDGELWVISYLERRPGFAGQVISTASDTIQLNLPDVPVKHFIIGKTWKWKNTEPYIFIKDMKEIKGQLSDSQLVYRVKIK